MNYNFPQSQEVYHWPEFIAFAKRLGIPLEIATMDLHIIMPLRECVIIQHEYRGEDMDNGGKEDQEERRKMLESSLHAENSDA